MRQYIVDSRKYGLTVYGFKGGFRALKALIKRCPDYFGTVRKIARYK